MQTQIHYQGLESTSWTEDFMTSRVQKLERYLGPSASIQVHVKQINNQSYEAAIAVHGFKHDYAFRSTGENLYQAFMLTLDKAVRTLSEEKRKLKDRIHRKFFT